MDAQPINKKELARKLSSLKDEFQREMDILINYHWDIIHKEMIDKADDICNLQDIYAAMIGEQDANLKYLREENEALKNQLLTISQERDYLQAVVKLLKDKNGNLRTMMQTINLWPEHIDPIQYIEDSEVTNQDVILIESGEENDCKRQENAEQSFQGMISISKGDVSIEDPTIEDNDKSVEEDKVKENQEIKEEDDPAVGQAENQVTRYKIH